MFEYQNVGISFLQTHNQALLFDDPGLGKTAQALHAADPTKPILIVCPASVKSVWQQEIKKWKIPVDIRITSGRGTFRCPEPGVAVITNPELLPDDPYLQWFSWNLQRDTQVIVDEAHQYKSFTAKRSKIMNSISRVASYNNGKVWFLTGTPILSTPKDLYGLLKAANLIDKTYGYWDRFVYYFKGINTKFGWKFPTEPRPDALKPLEPFYLRRRKADVLPDLPEKIYAEYEVETDFLETVEVDEESVVPSNTAASISSWRSRNAYAKAKAGYSYVEALRDSGEQVVVFSAHTDAANHFGALGGTITGATSQRDREALVGAFQAGQLRVLSGTIGAMGVGLTLTAACHCVFVDRDWNPAMNKQAEDRVCRIGQTRGVIITDIVSENSTDKLVTTVLNRKTRLIEATFGV